MKKIFILYLFLASLTLCSAFILLSKKNGIDPIAKEELLDVEYPIDELPNFSELENKEVIRAVHQKDEKAKADVQDYKNEATGLNKEKHYSGIYKDRYNGYLSLNEDIKSFFENTQVENVTTDDCLWLIDSRKKYLELDLGYDVDEFNQQYSNLETQQLMLLAKEGDYGASIFLWQQSHGPEFIILNLELAEKTLIKATKYGNALPIYHLYRTYRIASSSSTTDEETKEKYTAISSAYLNLFNEFKYGTTEPTLNEESKLYKNKVMNEISKHQETGTLNEFILLPKEIDIPNEYIKACENLSNSPS